MKVYSSRLRTCRTKASSSQICSRSYCVRTTEGQSSKRMPVRQQISKTFEEVIKEKFPSYSIKSTYPTTSSSSVNMNSLALVSRGNVDPKGGYQFNGCMAIAKHMNTTPYEIATSVMDALKGRASVFYKTYVSDPGFINLVIEEDWLAKRIHELVTNKESIRSYSLTDKPLNVLIDFASPNMCKELHVGHLRSTILGNCLSNLLEFVGHKVERISHVGDFGTPLGMVIAQAIDSKAAFVADPSSLPSPSYLSELYVAAKRRFDKEPEFAKRALQYAKHLQRKDDPSIVSIWSTLCAASRKGFNEIFDRLEVKVTERGESYYASMLPSIVKELQDKGLAVDSEGAKCIFLPGYKSPFVIEKSDGAHLYSTTDLAALKHRIQNKKDWIIYVTDHAQKLHFQQLFKVAEAAEWLVGGVRVNHVHFGLVKGEDGKKLASRDGAPVALLDLLNDALHAAGEVIKEHVHPDKSEPFFDQAATIKAIAYGAVKYYDLRHPRDYIFNLEHMLSFKGNTAVYLMYAFRIRSIRRKLTESDFNFSSAPHLTELEEINLANTIIQFHDIILEMEYYLAPHFLCEYLFELASKFHSFYAKCQVMGSPQQHSRLQLCVATELVLATGMQLLGLKTVEHL